MILNTVIIKHGVGIAKVATSTLLCSTIGQTAQVYGLLNAQDFSNLCWSAKAGQYDAELFTSFSDAERDMGILNAQGLSN